MTWYPIAFLPPQYDDSDGVPYSGAVLKAYEAGTSNVISMATDFTGATLATSFALNASGYPISAGGVIIIPHLQENYDLALYPDQASANANSGALWTVPNIQIAETVNTAFVQSFSGDGSTKDFTLSSDLGTDEKTVMIFADMLDEYSVNGDFATDSDWTKGTGWSIGSGVATATGAISTDLEQDAGIILVEGESYTITMTITRSAGSITPEIGGTTGTARSSSGTYTETILAGSTQKITFGTSGFTGTVDNVSVHRVNSVVRRILSPEEFTLANTDLALDVAPASGTNNIIVFAPSLLFGAVGAAAAAAATSETNAANFAAAAATSETNAATSETNAATSETNAATSETNAATSETNAAASEAAAAASADVMKYTFSTTTTMADPGTGVVRFNNATIASATAIAIDDLTATTGNPDLSDFINSFAGSTNTIKGQLQIRKSGTPATFVIFDVTGVTDNAGWSEIAVSYSDGNGTLSNADTLIISFTRAGDAGAGLANVVDDVTPQLGGTLDTNGKLVQFSKGTDIASATALVLGADGNYFDVTGTTTVTSIGTAGKVGTVIKLHFDDILTLTHHATDLILPGAANITTAAGDEAEFIEYAPGDWRCTSYNRASGEAVVAGGGGLGNNGFATNRYYYGYGWRNPSASGVTLTANRHYSRPFYVGADVTFTRIGINVITASGGTSAHLGIYEWADGVPGALVLDCGTVSTASTGEKEVTISQALPQGVYAVSVVSDGAPALAGSQVDLTAPPFFMGSEAGASSPNAHYGVYNAHTFGALPDPFGGSLTYVAAQGDMPCIWMRKV